MDSARASESSLLPSVLETSSLKRKRSPSSEHPGTVAPSSKAAKASNHLAINYLARQYNEDLPLVSNEDALPSILALLNEYQGVLDRHESMACNLGARPIGPILMNRFERLFDGPPKVLKSHGKEGTTISWLDVVEFARNKPEQFTLGTMSEGRRVCQFYTKQCRVQISEEDYLLIYSGMPQKLIPPQPIIEDEEKELGTLEILEKNLMSICHSADQVAARTRQINHRIKARKHAILDRRASDNGVSYTASSPSDVAMMNGSGANGVSSTNSSTPVGFVAVNAHQVSGANGASHATHNELMSKFFTLSDRRKSSFGTNGEISRLSSGNNTLPPITSAAFTSGRPTTATSSGSITYANDLNGTTTQPHATSPFPTAQTSLSTTNSSSSLHTNLLSKEKERDEGPYKAEMVSRMESLKKGDRVLPPCDRCRRLHMDCLKNLTACVGCTKKHAKCSWRDVREEELLVGVSWQTSHSVEEDSRSDGGSREREREVDGYGSGERNGSNANGAFLTDGGLPLTNMSAGMAGAHSLALDATSVAGLAAATSTELKQGNLDAPRYDYGLSRPGERESTGTPASSVDHGSASASRELGSEQDERESKQNRGWGQTVGA